MKKLGTRLKSFQPHRVIPAGSAGIQGQGWRPQRGSEPLPKVRFQQRLWFGSPDSATCPPDSRTLFAL